MCFPVRGCITVILLIFAIPIFFIGAYTFKLLFNRGHVPYYSMDADDTVWIYKNGDTFWSYNKEFWIGGLLSVGIYILLISLFAFSFWLTGYVFCCFLKSPYKIGKYIATRKSSSKNSSKSKSKKKKKVVIVDSDEESE